MIANKTTINQGTNDVDVRDFRYVYLYVNH